MVDIVFIDGFSWAYLILSSYLFTALIFKVKSDHNSFSLKQFFFFLLTIIFALLFFEGSFWHTNFMLHRGIPNLFYLLPLVFLFSLLLPKSLSDKLIVSSPTKLLSLTMINGALLSWLQIAQNFDAIPTSDSRYYDHFGKLLLNSGELMKKIEVMPLYPIWLNLQNFLLGHEFWIQQISQLTLFTIVIFFIYQSTLNFTGRQSSALFSAWIVSTYSVFTKYIHIPQIENFFYLIIAFYIFCFSQYWAKPNRLNKIIWFSSVALILLTRTQGVAFAIGTGIILLLWPQQKLSEKMANALLYCIVVFVLLLPWGVANIIYNDNFRLSTPQTNSLFGISNHPSGKYGVLKPSEEDQITAQLYEEFPNDVQKRNSTSSLRALDNYINNPSVFITRAYHRTLAHLGLWLNVFFDEGPQLIKYRNTLWGWGKNYILLILISFFSIFLFRKNRPALYLSLIFFANYGILLLFSIGDPRPRYPFDLLLIILSGFLVNAENLKPLQQKVNLKPLLIPALPFLTLFFLFLNRPLWPEWKGYISLDSTTSQNSKTPEIKPENKVSMSQLNLNLLNQRIILEALLTNYFNNIDPISFGQFLNKDTRTFDQLHIRYYTGHQKKNVIILNLKNANISKDLKENSSVSIQGTVTQIEPSHYADTYFIDVYNIALKN